MAHTERHVIILKMFFFSFVQGSVIWMGHVENVNPVHHVSELT